MTFNLLYLDSFDSDFNGNTYKIYQFLDKSSLTVISGTNLDVKGDLVPYKAYNCNVEFRRNKLKVTSISQ